eukprot:113114_1
MSKYMIQNIIYECDQKILSIHTIDNFYIVMLSIDKYGPYRFESIIKNIIHSSFVKNNIQTIIKSDKYKLLPLFQVKLLLDSGLLDIKQFITVNDVIASNISPINPDISESVNEMQSNIHLNKDLQLKRNIKQAQDPIYEPRTIYKSCHIGQKPSQNLTCIYACILLLFILIIAAMSCIDRYIINIYINPYESGIYYWQFGWTNAIFYHEDALLINENQVPMQFVKQYAVDSGRFFIVSTLIIILCLLFALIILCLRCNNEVYLYIKCFGIRIPQSPGLYILFSTIKH